MDLEINIIEQFWNRNRDLIAWWFVNFQSKHKNESFVYCAHVFLFHISSHIIWSNPLSLQNNSLLTNTVGVEYYEGIIECLV